MKKLLLVLLVATTYLICGGCKNGSKESDPNSLKTPQAHSSDKAEESESSIQFEVARDTVYDKPIKTQIEQHIVVSGVPTANQLRKELVRRYEAARARRGFRYHNPPTNVYIYIYGSDEQARSEQPTWIGMIARGASDNSDPEPVIDDDRLSALSAQPEERFGLSEDSRRAALKEIFAAELRATNEAMAQVPDSSIMKQIELERKLQKEYKQDVAERYRVTESELSEIAIEGIKKGWPR